MKVLARALTSLALVPVAVIALWVLGWRHWTCVIGALLIAVFVVLTTLPRPLDVTGAPPPAEINPTRRARKAPR